MTIEDETSHNEKGKKRNLFRKSSSGEHGASESSSIKLQSKLRWASHLGQRDRAQSEASVSRNHPWKVPSGKKLQWSPRLGQGKNGNDAEYGETSETLNDKKMNLALHWSPKPGRKSRDEDSASNEALNGSETSSLRGEPGIPRQVGGSPVQGADGSLKKKFSWPSTHVELSDSISDDISEEGSTKNEKVKDCIHKIRRKRNPRGKQTQWSYRMGENRIDEEEEHQLPLGDSLDPLKGLYHHALAGDLEVPEGNNELFPADDNNPIPNRQRSATEPNIKVAASVDDRVFHRVHSLERNSSPQSFRGGGSFDGDIISLRGGHSVSSSVATAPGIAREGSPVRNKQKTERKGFRVKPFHCFDPPVYMTESEIHIFSLQPSQKVEFLESYIAPSTMSTKKIKVGGETERIWGTTVDGRVGSLRVEVLGCIGLASVKPDVAAYLICGDVPFVTDVIHACRSPRWPPNCKRAVVFPVHHAYARLFAGVFASKKDKANDEFCGRVVLDLAVLRPNTAYDVTLPLRASSFIYDRRPRGVIRLRFSLHWFSERAAVMSYLRRPHSLVASPCGDSNPSVLCADPKTFRNVAITVHGQDLPGKYTRKAFRATIREFNLTRVNLIFLVRTLASEAVLYENPLVSFYLFITWMHCVYADSVKLAPAYFVGYLILSLFNNYESFNQDPSRYLGFSPPTLQEMLYALVSPREREAMRPILVTKKATHISQRNLLERQHSGSALGFSEDVFNGDVKPLDHREFPFSEKLEYPRFRPEDAIVPNKNSNVPKTLTPDPYLYGRLSSYASEKMSSLQSALPISGGHDEDEWAISDNEEELELSDSDDHMRVDGDNVFMESDNDEDGEGMTSTGAHVDPQRRIPVGPPQNCDVKPVKNVPPQAVLARAENTLHSLTFGLSMDKLFHSSLAVGKRPSVTFEREGSVEETPDATTRSRRRSRTPFDEFDKRLGLRIRSKNPVIGIASSFLGPLMRMFRIFLIATRVVFNVGVWKDPFLSFWVLCFLVALMLLLLIFPWRPFMFLVGIVCFGPQNILVQRVQRMLLRHATKAERMKPQTEAERTTTDEDSTAALSDGSPSEKSGASSSGMQGDISETVPPVESTGDDSDLKKTSKGRRRRLQNKFASMRERRRARKNEKGTNEPDPQPMPPRPAFSAATYQKAPKVPLEPRAVVVPYTRVRTERFYDWPPDPTVSRATPVLLADSGIAQELPIPPASEASASPQGLILRRQSAEI